MDNASTGSGTQAGSDRTNEAVAALVKQAADIASQASMANDSAVIGAIVHALALRRLETTIEHAVSALTKNLSQSRQSRSVES